jgi:hypothetical protein
MIRRLLALPFVALITFSACQSAFSKDFEDLEFKDLIAAKQPPLNAPAARMPSPDKLVFPAQENIYFPVRGDGQPYVLAEDMTVNWTQALNEYYFDPKWRGEVWGPFPMYFIIERAVRMMPTYPEYDQFSTIRVGNGWHKFWEKYSGYGP